MRILLLLLILFFQTLSYSAVAETAPPQFAIGLGLDVATGTFGTGSTSTYVMVPLIIDWFPTERSDLEISVPFLYQQTENTGHAALGTTANNSMQNSVARRNMAGSGGGGGTLGGEESGLGDITLTGGYTLVQDSDSTPRIRSSLYMKFPTADDSNGLGTGAFDFGSGVDISKWLGNWQPFAEGRYIFQGGSHAETGARDYATADTGVGYSWSERFYTSIYARFGSAIAEGMSAPLEARLKTVWRFAELLYLDAYAAKGFSDGSPDYSGGISVFVEF